MTRRLAALLGFVLVAALTVIAAPGPASAAGPLDCTSWRYGPADEPASLPPEYNRDDYRRTSFRDTRPELANSPQNLCGQKGSAVDLAWGLSRGREDVVIAVLDSGIRWRSTGAMSELATKVHIELGEAPPPCFPGEPDGDCNGDDVFDLDDFGAITDRNANGVADPEDLILDPAISDGVDDDGDGYVDDIAGWDFLYGDNDPFDTVDYGHGTGEAEDSTAAENGTGDVGNCPRCQFIPVRVGDSFIADGARFAAGVLFSLDQGADVIQEALGALNNPIQAQQAIDAAYSRGVVVVASMADEAAEHPNLPAVLEHTMAVNSVTEKDSIGGGANQGWLALNGCTNFGGHTFVAVPSNSCSSEATGQSAGMVGLIESYAREQGVAPHPGLAGEPGDNVLSANETMQIVASTADDIDFSTPNSVDPANNFGTPTGNPILDTVRYQTRPGWDAIFGYGRVNAYEMLKAVRDEGIPPEAMIDGPSWFDLLPVTGTVDVTGAVAAVRADSYDYRVEWAPGLQPPAHPATDTWTAINEQTGLTAPVSGNLGTLDLATVAAALPDGGSGPPVDPTDDNRPDADRFAARIRVVVTAHGGPGDGLTGEMQKQIFVHDDPDLVTGMPARIDSVGTASPQFVDLDGGGRDELVLATDDGAVHAYKPNMTEVPGFPVFTPVPAWWPTASQTAAEDGIPLHHSGVSIGGPAIGDLDRDGSQEIVAADLDGTVSVWSHSGGLLATMHVDPAFSVDTLANHDEFNRTKPGFGSAPALGDLDDDGDLEIVAASLDRHVYAWHFDGTPGVETPVDGFPVVAVDPAKVSAVDPVSHHVTFAGGSNAREGGELLATPALADLTGDGRPEIIIGGQEEYQETPNIGDGAAVLALLAVAGSTGGNSRVYAISPDGSNATVSPTSLVHPHAQAYLPGWPVKVAMVDTEVLPTIGDGVAMQVAVGDVHPNAGPEVVAASAAGPLYVLDAAGDSVYGATGTGDLPLVWTAGTDLAQADANFGANRNSNDLVASFASFSGASVADFSGDGQLEPTAPTAGLTRLIDVQLPDQQLPSDDQLSGWNGATRLGLEGSPQATSDLAFFVTPAIADLDDDGDLESIAGNSTYTMSAFDASGNAPAGWPKFTGGWTLGTPGVGDWDGDGTLEVAQPRRDGVLLVWSTDGNDAPAWGGYGCDEYHAGQCSDTAVADPYCAAGMPGPFADVPRTHQFCADIAWSKSADIAGGYTDGTFRPASVVSRQAMASFLYNLEGSPAFTLPSSPTFSDVPPTHPFFGAIEWLAAEGVVMGFPDGTFRPGAPVSRQAMAAFLFKLAPLVPLPACPPGGPFPDVPPSNPFCGQILWLTESGIANGFSDGTFRPTNPVSRQAMAAFLHRFVDA